MVLSGVGVSWLVFTQNITHFVALTYLELVLNSRTSANSDSSVLGLKACAITTGPHQELFSRHCRLSAFTMMASFQTSETKNTIE